MTTPAGLGRYPHPIELRTRPDGSLVRLLAMCALFVLVSIGLLVTHPAQHVAVMCWLGIVFFGGGGALLGWQRGRRTVVVRLTPEGLDDRSTLASPGLTPWSEVVGAQPRLVVGQPSVAVVVRDPDAMLQRIPVGRRALATQNLRGFAPHTPLWISAAGLPVDADQLAAIINDYLAAWRAGHPAGR